MQINHEFDTQEVVPSPFPVLGVLSVYFGALFILFTAVSGIQAPPVAVDGMMPFQDSLRWVLVIFMLASLLYPAFLTQRRLGTAVLPLFINASTFLIVTFVPFATIWQDMQFRWKWPEYQEVVQLVSTGELQADAEGVVQLPRRYRHLTADGSVRTVVAQSGTIGLFFTKRRTSPHDFDGFLYQSGDQPPQPDQFGGRWQQIIRKRPSWFYCEST